MKRTACAGLKRNGATTAANEWTITEVAPLANIEAESTINTKKGWNAQLEHPIGFFVFRTNRLRHSQIA